VIVDYYKSYDLKSREVRWTKLLCRKLLLAAKAGGNSLVADLVWTLVLESQATSLSKDLANDE